MKGMLQVLSNIEKSSPSQGPALGHVNPPSPGTKQTAHSNILRMREDQKTLVSFAKEVLALETSLDMTEILQVSSHV